MQFPQPPNTAKIERRSRRSRLWVLPIALLGVGLEVAAADPDSLFSQHAPLSMALEIDMSKLCRDPAQANCEDVAATLVYDDSRSAQQRVSVRVWTRGNFRADHCAMPPLFLSFSESADGTVFDGQTMLPLTTHCRHNSRAYEQYVLREYLGYRVYQQLSDKSLGVRLVRVTYSDPSGRNREVERHAFFTEHFDSVASRHTADVYKPERFDPHQSDSRELAVLDLFQYMIGNTDWSMIYGHNILLIRTPNGTATPLPFDLDFSGLVSADYATPPSGLPIRSVRQRIFRGFCRADTDWPAVFAHFKEHRAEVLALVDEVPDLSKSRRKRTARYLASFFEVLDSEKRRQKSIVDACRSLIS